jgi:hypothetical protein
MQKGITVATMTWLPDMEYLCHYDQNMFHLS